MLENFFVTSQPRVNRKRTTFRGNELSAKDYILFKENTSYHWGFKHGKVDNIFEDKYIERNKNIYSHSTIGGLEFKYPTSIENVIKEIRNSVSILELTENWDDAGAAIVNSETWEKAVLFLFNYALHIYTQSELKNILIEPDIAAVNDGSIDLTWRTEKARLLVNIKPQSLERASYYTDLYSDKDFSKRSVSTDLINEGFAGWLNFFKKPNVGN